MHSLNDYAFFVCREEELPGDPERVKVTIEGFDNLELIMRNREVGVGSEYARGLLLQELAVRAFDTNEPIPLPAIKHEQTAEFYSGSEKDDEPFRSTLEISFDVYARIVFFNSYNSLKGVQGGYAEAALKDFIEDKQDLGDYVSYMTEEVTDFTKPFDLDMLYAMFHHIGFQMHTTTTLRATPNK